MPMKFEWGDIPPPHFSTAVMCGFLHWLSVAGFQAMIPHTQVGTKKFVRDAPCHRLDAWEFNLATP